MKYALISLLISWFINPCWAIAVDAASDADAWRAQLIPLCENYDRYLPAQYLCCLTKFGHWLANSSTRTDELHKHEQLKKLIEHLAGKDWAVKDVHNFLMDTMSPYVDPYSKTFFRCAARLLRPHLVEKREVLDANADQENKWPGCVVCMDADAVNVFIRCGHLVTCDLCVDQMKRCPLCNIDDTAVEKLEGERICECQKCFKNKANILLQKCKHLSLCQTCVSDISGDLFCPVCAETSSNNTKVFSN